MPWGNGRWVVVAVGVWCCGLIAPARGFAPIGPPPPEPDVNVTFAPAGALNPPKDFPVVHPRAVVARAADPAIPVVPQRPGSLPPIAPAPALPAPDVRTPLKDILPPAESAPASPAVPPHDAHGTVKDLTPPGFAEYEPHANGHGSHGGHHEVPGHLLPAAPEEGGLFTSVELLLLRPRRGAFDYVIPNGNGGLATTGDVRSLQYELRTGVRAELGYRFGDTGWDVLAGYTNLRSNAFDSGFAGPGQVLLPTLTRPGLTDNVLFAAAEANLEYNVYDAQVGRRFAVDDHFAVRAYGGLRFASVRQDLKAYYDGLDARRALVSARSDFQGFGPMIGTEGVWAGWRGFHLYARASGGFLTGQSDNPLQETNGSGSAAYVNSRYDVRKVVPFASVGVGGGWQYRTVSVRVGYEITHYGDIISQPRFVDDVGQGKFVSRPADLSLEGLFLQVGLAF